MFVSFAKRALAVDTAPLLFSIYYKSGTDFFCSVTGNQQVGGELVQSNRTVYDPRLGTPPGQLPPLC